MITNINISESYLYDHELRKRHAEQYAFTQKSIEKIRKIALKKIQYPEYVDAYDYVDSLFPSSNVKSVAIHKVAMKDLEKMGLTGVEGFYDPVTKIVVIAGSHKSSYYGDPRYKVEAKIEKDEVVVHELCHYCYIDMGHRSISSEMREEFAYGHSVGYLRQKGYSDEQIIKYNFLPYLMNIFNQPATTKILAQNGITMSQYCSFSKYKRNECSRKYRKKVFELSKEMAEKRGMEIIDLYSSKIEEGGNKTDEENDNGYGRFDIMDFS